MANNFKIVISATDKATGSIKKINDSMSRLTRPFANVQKSMKSLGREIGRNPVVKGLAGITRAAEGVAESVAKIAAPMAALVGVGSVAGVTQLATGWAKLGFEIGNTSATLGVSTSDLQNWRGAARLAGLSSEEVTGSLKAFGTTLQDASFQRNPEAQKMLEILGIKLSKTSTGAIDTTKALLDLADALASPKLKGKAQEQGLIGRVLNVEGSLPLLRRGSAEIRRLQREAASLNPIKDNAAIKSAEAFTRQLFQMDTAIDGLKQSIGGALLPVLKPVVEQFTQLIAANREAIAKKIGEWAEKFTKWFSSLTSEDWDNVGTKIKTVGDAIMSVADGIIAATTAWEKWTSKDKKDTPGVNKGLGLRFGKKQDLDADDVANGRAPAAGRSSGGRIGGFPTVNGRTPGVRFDDPKLNDYASQVEKRLGLPANILNGIKNFGERSNSDAVSKKGAMGVMQFMPDTWKQYGKGDPTDPYASIDAGGRYVQDMLKRYGGNTAAAITEYNGGIAQARAVAAGSRPWVAETSNYLSRVQGGMQQMGSGPAEMQHNFTMTIEGLPAGVNARVRNQTGQSIPVRTVMPMPAFGA